MVGVNCDVPLCVEIWMLFLHAGDYREAFLLDLSIVSFRGVNGVCEVKHSGWLSSNGVR